MQKTSFPKFWIVIDHPQQLAIAICISRYCNKEFGFKGNLVISKHAYWKGVKFREYRKEFARVKWFERLDYPPPWLSLYLQLAASMLLIPKMFKLTKFVKNLKIDMNDIIIGLSTQQFLENKILSFYPKTKKIGVVVSYVYGNSKKEASRKKYRYSLGSFIVKYLEFFFGMHEVVCKYWRRTGKKLDGDTRQKYKRPLNEIYDYLLVMKNISEEITEISNKLKTNIIFTKYPYTYSLAKVNSLSRKKIVFLGEDFLSVNNIGHQTHAHLINKCLDFLRKNYSEEFDLVYIPHPRWNRELEILNLSGFSIYKDHDPAEIFFIKNRTNIHAVFSVISTASRSAMNSGLPSYVFYEMFPFRKSTARNWSELLGKMRKEAFIANFRQKPRKIEMGFWQDNHIIFMKHLGFVIKRLTGGL
jgi:hypothetical protein